MGCGGAGPLLIASGGRVLWVRPEGPDPSRRLLLLATEEDERGHLGWSGRRTWAGLLPRVGLCLCQLGCIPEQVLPRAALGAFHEAKGPGCIRFQHLGSVSPCPSSCHSQFVLVSWSYSLISLSLPHSLPVCHLPLSFTSHPPQFPSGSRTSQEGLADAEA